MRAEVASTTKRLTSSVPFRAFAASLPSLERFHRPPPPPDAARTSSLLSCFARAGFSEVPDLLAGRALHAYALRHSLALATFHSNTLLTLYARHGKIRCAFQVFDRMPLRSPASWNAAVSACVNAGMFSESVALFRSMRVESVAPNTFVLASMVTACDRSGMMALEGLQFHGVVEKSGLGGDVYVGTALLHFYGTYGLLPDAKRIFSEMPARNVVSWTALMGSCSKNGYAEESIMAYQDMRREGVDCNANSFATVVSSCASLGTESLSLQVLGHVVVSGYIRDVSVGNSLITLLGFLQRLDYAEYIFDNLGSLDLISWNSMISAYTHNGARGEALACFSRMCCIGWWPDSTTLSSLVFACDSIDHLNLGMGLHAYGIKSALCHNITVSNTFVNMYSSSGRFGDAEHLFHEVPEKDLICWNSMISSYVESGDDVQALCLFAQLLMSNHELNRITFAAALSACSSPEALLDGKCIHCMILRSGIRENMFLSNALISMYSNCGDIGEGKKVFQAMNCRDVVSWNALIGGLVESEEKDDAMLMFNLMRHSGCKANYITITNILGIGNVSSDLPIYGLPLHSYVISVGFESDGFVRNSILAMYARCGDFESGKFYFNKLEHTSNVSWNALISSMAHHDRAEESLNLFKDMHCSGVKVDPLSLSGSLVACANLALLEEGQQFHSLAVKLGLDSDLYVNNACMDMYGKSGNIDAMIKMLPSVNYRSRQAWNILISGYARHGYFMRAKETFMEMLKKGPKPDHITMVSLLSSCNHAGLVNEGLEYFSFMKSELNIAPTLEHCVCIVDLLGRSGRLVEAQRFIDDMPVPPNDVIWRSLLASSRIHGNMEIGWKAASRLLELDSTDDSAYVLFSNVCAINRKWEDVQSVRTRMRSINLRKRPACSWIKFKNKVYTFGIGQMHLEAPKLSVKLKELLQIVKEAGYVADTAFSLHDTDEEQKEHNLWNHSEKLALAFGLMSLPDGFCIRVFKNLRVCGDCHNVYKLVSSATHREIILRDPYRFHHFKNGNCSCSDYW